MAMVIKFYRVSLRARVCNACVKRWIIASFIQSQKIQYVRGVKALPLNKAHPTNCVSLDERARIVNLGRGEIFVSQDSQAAF